MKTIRISEKLLALALVVTTFYLSQASAGDSNAGKEKAKTCAACHGMDGNSIAPNFPNLAGQGEGYLLKQMHDFKKGARKDPTMNAMIMPLDNTAMADIAAFFTTQKIKPRQADPKQIEAGKKIYKGGIRETSVPACMACHGPTGAGMPGSRFPRLSSQSAAYIEKQLKDFRAAAQNPAQDTTPIGRYNDPNAMMRNAVKLMNDYQIKAVAQYVQGLQP